MTTNTNDTNLVSKARDYRVNLLRTPRVIEYLRCLGVSGATAEHLGMGYDPGSDCIVVPSVDASGSPTGFASRPVIALRPDPVVQAMDAHMTLRSIYAMALSTIDPKLVLHVIYLIAKAEQRELAADLADVPF